MDSKNKNNFFGMPNSHLLLLITVIIILCIFYALLPTSLWSGLVTLVGITIAYFIRRFGK